MKAIQFASCIEGVRPLKDGSMSLTFHTQEMPDKEKLVILNLIGKFGWLLFKEDDKDYDEADIPKANSGYEDTKTPSQRLRSVIYVYWEKHKKSDYPDFEDYYKKQLESLIIQYKNKIED